jgi:hypothetical protein
MDKFTKYDDFRLYQYEKMTADEVLLSYKDCSIYFKECDELFNKKIRWQQHERILCAMGCI